MYASGKREIWVDNVKVFACILVVLGHFFQSMVESSILPATGVFMWFEKTIYTFHVPLFFICSGYLYQRYSRVDSLRAWRDNILKKLLTLGVPYFTFSTVTWGLKTVFSSTVNTNVGGGDTHSSLIP
jgi:fucose 4-O-acetylase-like acetyltransferase